MSRPARIILWLLAAALSFGTDRAARAVDPATAGASAPLPLLRLTFVEPARGAQGGAAAATLEVTVEGQVRIGGSDGSMSEAPPLPRAELSRFVEEIVRTHRLLELDSRSLAFQIDEASRSTGLSAQIPGAAATVVEFTWEGRSHRVECTAVGLLSRRFPQVRDLQDLAAVQARLQNVVAISQVGGLQEAERLAREGTAQLQQEQPRATPFTVRDLAMVRTLPDGALFVQFYRDSAPQPTIVGVTRFPESTRRVSVFNGAREIR